MWCQNYRDYRVLSFHLYQADTVLTYSLSLACLQALFLREAVRPGASGLAAYHTEADGFCFGTGWVASRVRVWSA